jgi:hypothetical protein
MLWDPRSGIQDPEKTYAGSRVIKSPNPGSGSATLTLILTIAGYISGKCNFFSSCLLQVEEELSPEEEERRRIRRERNKQAAARCRKRRMDQTTTLQVGYIRNVDHFTSGGS